MSPFFYFLMTFFVAVCCVAFTGACPCAFCSEEDVGATGAALGASAGSTCLFSTVFAGAGVSTTHLTAFVAPTGTPIGAEVRLILRI